MKNPVLIHLTASEKLTYAQYEIWLANPALQGFGFPAWHSTESDDAREAIEAYEIWDAQAAMNVRYVAATALLILLATGCSQAPANTTTAATIPVYVVLSRKDCKMMIAKIDSEHVGLPKRGIHCHSFHASVDMGKDLLGADNRYQIPSYTLRDDSKLG